MSGRKNWDRKEIWKRAKKVLDKWKDLRYNGKVRYGGREMYLVNWITQRRTRLTPWTIIMDCLSVLERITANENSWVINASSKLFKTLIWSRNALDTTFWEFDPGSGRTLAACLTHASRTGWFLRGSLSGERVSNAWGTCLSVGDNSWKRLLIPHNVTGWHHLVTKDLLLKDGLASD